MGQVVLHFEKHGNPTSGSLGNHIDRTVGMEWSYRHADLSRTHLNRSYQLNDYCKMSYNEAIRKRVQDGYKKTKAIRKDATYSVNTMLSASHEDMKAIEGDPKKLNEWIKQNANWCIRQFGKENIIRFTVHLDEKTPHIHCVFVPITKDGGLSAKEFIGSSQKLENLQTSYANAMKGFGLERGIKSDRKHQTTEEYRRREAQKLAKVEQLHEKIEGLSKKNLLFGLEDLKKDLKAGLNSFVMSVNEDIKTMENVLLTEKEQFKDENKKLIQQIENHKPQSKYIRPDDVYYIVTNSNLIDYFLYLANRGDLIFEKKSGKEFIFTDEARTKKISVSEKGWHDLKSGEGGQIIKAVQIHQKLDWLEAVNWLKNFNGGISMPFQEIRKKTAEEKEIEPNRFSVTQVIEPSSPKLIKYFNDRGISTKTLKEYTKQVHYQSSVDSHYYGIGTQNVRGGYEIRSPFGKTKFGTSDISELGQNPEAEKIIVCEGLTDALSIIEILKNWGRNLNEYCVISLNSVTNTQKFIDKYKGQNKTMHLLLDGDTAGDEATKKILEALNGERVRDVRDDFGIHSQGYKDINEHLTKEIAKQKKQQQKQEEPPRKGYGFKR